VPTVNLSDLDGGISHPELFFGVVAAIGTPWPSIDPFLRAILTARGYHVEPTIRVSELLKGFRLKCPYPRDGVDERTRVTMLMDMGDELRRVTGRSEALALMVAAKIAAMRPETKDRSLAGRAFFIHQVKHPDEVLWFRHIYGDAFHLIGLYSPRSARAQFLTTLGMSMEDAEALIVRDEDEQTDWGQQLRNTFHLADVFIEMRADSTSTEHSHRQLSRFLDLLFGTRIISPTRDEYGMYLAEAAALRSADLSRQVGAAILDQDGEVLALGGNEVPMAGGGQYWGDDDGPDYRDFQKGQDFNEFMKRSSITELLEQYDAGWAKLGKDRQERAIDRLASTRVANLTEFGRAVHAEMEAILSAARRGVRVKGATLYSTTFPCHNCAKHIVGAGIRRVTYVEPYPKSLAGVMHDDSIGFTEDHPNASADLGTPDKGDDTPPLNKVWFGPYVGVAPRRYRALFSHMSQEGLRHKWKKRGGAVSTTPIGLRLRARLLSHVEREALAALAAQSLHSLETKEHTR